MQPYVIFTESTGDLTPALIERAGLRVLPMSFNLDGQAYRNWPDGREISPHDYYDKLRAGSVCTTSQVTLAEFEEAFTPVLEAARPAAWRPGCCRKSSPGGGSPAWTPGRPAWARACSPIWWAAGG